MRRYLRNTAHFPAARPKSINASWRLFLLIFVFGATNVIAQSNPGRTANGPVAIYNFDEGAGDRVADSSGHKNDGTVVGGSTWGEGLRGRSVVFDGSNYIRIQSTKSLNLHGPLSISAWIRGKASPLRFVDGYRHFRSPYFQVAGDKIYLTTNSDDWPDMVWQNRPAPADFSAKQILEFKDLWHLWTGIANINLTDWRYIKRTSEPFSAIEPKLQFAKDKIYYEYFGQDANKVWQIWTADSDADGGNYRVTQRTSETSGYRVEQDSNIQVVDDRVYIGFPQEDDHQVWQLMTARFDRDGANYHAVQRTSDHGWIPSIQVVNDTIFYLYYKNGLGHDNEHKDDFEIWVAQSDRDGQHWRVLRKISEGNSLIGEGATFQVHGDSIYVMYAAPKDNGESGTTYLYTGHMGLDGEHFETIQRTFTKGFVLVSPASSLQVVGKKIYYTFVTEESERTLAQVYADRKAAFGPLRPRHFWTAESDLDGGNWNAISRDQAPSDVRLGYRGLQVVGAKEYFGSARFLPLGLTQERLGVAGANIVSKGDAFGIGVTESGDARAFINAGQDYLYRAEAPSDVAGAIADSTIDEDRWHHLLMTYDNHDLRLYVDGELKASTPYEKPAADNPFPLLIGDGFKGTVDNVSIYDRVLTVAEVRNVYQSENCSTINSSILQNSR
jgi:hypothetical protein